MTDNTLSDVLAADSVHDVDASSIEATATDDGTHEITAAQQRQRADMGMRYALASALNSELGGGQDKYDTFNWDENPTVEDYYAMYLRNAYARAVCDQPVDTTWRDAPEIKDQGESGGEDDTDTEFEQAVDRLVEDTRLWHYCHRADKLSGIGEYGILVLEFDDIESPDGFSDEVNESAVSELQGLRPFSQASIEAIEVGGPGSGRWGEPETYELDLSDEDDAVDHKGPDELEVHHSRVIHIPSDGGLLDDEIRGTPRQEPIWNNLTDIEKALGSAGEVAYRASAWGINVNIDSDYKLEDGGEELKDHLQRWYYGLEPILRTQGADEVQNLGGETIDPSPVVDNNIEAISAEKRIPQSVLKGNETGDRATEQDLKEWYGHIGSRREEYATPMFARAIIDRCLRYGALPAPVGQVPDRDVGGYDVDWQPLAESDQGEIAATEKTRAEVLDTLPDLTVAMSVAQRAEYVEDGTLPSEFDDEGGEMDEAALQQQFEEMQDQLSDATPGQSPPAVADGGTETGE